MRAASFQPNQIGPAGKRRVEADRLLWSPKTVRPALVDQRPRREVVGRLLVILPLQGKQPAADHAPVVGMQRIRLVRRRRLAANLRQQDDRNAQRAHARKRTPLEALAPPEAPSVGSRPGGLSVWPTPRLIASCFVAWLALLVSSAPAGAAPKRVSGNLTKAGYTLIALAADGRAMAMRARAGRFRVTPPAARVTLHLRGSDGIYAGPIVVGGRGRRAVLGVRTGAKLGRIVVRRGYARVARKLPEKWLDAARKARAVRGVPIGVGRFGRVRSGLRSGGVPGDADLDGIPDVLDIDDDGDLVLDKLDRLRAARASQAPDNQFTLFSDLTGHVWETANANARNSSGAPSFTDQEIDAVLPRRGLLLVSLLPGDLRELDCGGTPNPAPPPPLLGGLPYCSHGGSGRVFAPAVEYLAAPAFPDCCDPDGDGFGTLSPAPDSPGPARFFYHGATTAQIGTGDVLIQRVTSAGVERQFPATLQYVFGTVPALVSYDDGQGNSGAVSYPVPGPGGPSPVPPGPGSRENGIPVAAGSSGVVVTLTFWRPQRRPIPPETAPWIDMGGLNYGAGIADVGESCPRDSLSETDPNLTSTAGPSGVFTDLAGDQPADPRNTFTYALNMTGCLAAHGRAWSPGEVRGFRFPAQTPNGLDQAGQHIFFKRVP